MVTSISESWGDAEAQELRAALAFMDDWDGELSALFSVDADADSQPKPAKSKALYKRPRAAWKQEMAAIRQQVEVMEQGTAAQKAQGKACLKHETATENEWEALKTAQQNRRVAADVENAKLRKTAESQVKVAKQILGLTKRVKLLEDALWVPPSISTDHYLGPHIDPRFQMRQLDAMVSEAAEIFSKGKFAQDVRQSFRDVQFRDGTPTEEGLELEFHAAWMLPFGVGRVADALWSQTNRPTFEGKSLVYKDLYEDASSLVTQFISSAGANDWWGGSHGTSAARRLPHPTADGSILIVVITQARAYANAKCQGSGDVEGWMRIDKAPFEGSHSISRVQWYRRTRLGPPPDATLTKSERRKWTHTVTTSDTRSRFQQDLDWSVQAIDNLLLTRTSDQQRC